MAPACENPWTKSTKDVLDEFEVSQSTGLSDEEVDRRRQKYGFNELAKEPPTPLWKLIAEQFDDTLVKVRADGHLNCGPQDSKVTWSWKLLWNRSTRQASHRLLNSLQRVLPQILLASAGVSFGLAFFDEEARKHEGLRAFVEPLVILLILILNAAVGVWQESRSEAALDALKELQSEHARVLRNGKMVSTMEPLGSWRPSTWPWHLETACTADTADRLHCQGAVLVLWSAATEDPHYGTVLRCHEPHEPEHMTPPCLCRLRTCQHASWCQETSWSFTWETECQRTCV